MPDHPVSPSPMLRVFVHAARRRFPPDQRAELATFGPAVGATTARADARRARRCAEWAMTLAADTDPSHPGWARVHELHRAWHDLWFGTRMGTSGPHGRELTVGEDVHILWVEEAVDVAVLLGEEQGWDHPQWPALLRELVAMEDVTG